MDSNAAAGNCEVCGKPATVHRVEIKDGKKTSGSFCIEHVPRDVRGGLQNSDEEITSLSEQAALKGTWMMEQDLDSNSFKELFGPGTIDTMLRQAFKICWMSLPTERRNVAGMEAEMRRLF